MDEVVRFTFSPKDFVDSKHPKAEIMQSPQFLGTVSRLLGELLETKISTKPTITFEQDNEPHLIIEVNAVDRDIFLRLFKTMIVPAVIQFFAETAV